MAIIDLGTRTISIGDLPSEYAPFFFDKDEAYIIRGTTTIEFPNNVYSVFRITPIFTNANNSGTRTHHDISIEITEGSFVFLLPFSGLYADDGTVTIRVERKPLIFGTGDTAGEVTLNLTYDDEASEKTWL